MDPERKIEKLLRAYAKKRRADAGEPLKLHPAMRRLLRDEVARQPNPREEKSVSLWQLLQQQWALLAGFALVFFFCATLLLPALSPAKRKAQNVTAVNNLKEIGLAVQLAAEANGGKLPPSLDALTNQFAPEKMLTDPRTGKPFVYVAGGEMLDELSTNAVVAYSPEDENGRAVLFADDRVEFANPAQFSELTNRRAAQLALENRSKVEALSRASFQLNSLSAGEALDESHISHSSELKESPNLNPPSSKSSQAEQQAIAMAPPVPAPAGIPETATLAAAPNAAAGQEFSQAAAIQPASALPAAVPVMADRLLATQAFYYRNVAQINSGNSDTYSGNITPGQTFGARSPAITQNASSSAQITSVLANFQLQQNGDAIRVVDSDGSIYAGSLFPTEAAAQNTPATIAGAAGSVPEASRAAGNGPQTTGYFDNKTIEMPPQARTNGVQTLSFRVAGMNHTLQQNVVFNGSFLAASNVSNSPPAGISGFGGGGFGGIGQLQPPIYQQQQLQLSSLRVTGNATIGQTNEINIYALPVTQQQQN